MRRKGEPESSQQGPSSTDTDSDRYPDAVTALRRIAGEAELPKGPVERIEATFLANGDCTYRVWEARSEEAAGGFIPVE